MSCCSCLPDFAYAFLISRAIPRSAAAFTGSAGGEGSNRGPGGVVLLCVNNTAIPCTSAGNVKAIQFTVLNVREKGWIRAPWYPLVVQSKPKPQSDQTDN
jgi:hypothetical protein